jgi:hypothetical protein
MPSRTTLCMPSRRLPEPQGNAGWLVWQHDHLPALIDWNDPVLKHGLQQRIKFVRLVRRLVLAC